MSFSRCSAGVVRRRWRDGAHIHDAARALRRHAGLVAGDVGRQAHPATVNKDHAEVRSDWRGDPVQIKAEHRKRDEPAVTEVLIVLLAALLLLAGTGFSSGLPNAGCPGA